MSLSARRAWIEIPSRNKVSFGRCVALRKESVDRNFQTQSPIHPGLVALRKESVDRNIYPSCRNAQFPRRSPQGERG